MPGPGPHMMYAMGTGLGLMSASEGQFSAHHCLCYTLNAFFGPDIGAFFEWLYSTLKFKGPSVEFIHHPFYYIFLLSIPLGFLYQLASRFSLRRGFLDSPSGVPLSWKQSFLLISAGSLSHFFLDHLFEENGRTKMYAWILGTGWWVGRARIHPDAVVVVAFLCCSLIGGFIYINRVKPSKSVQAQYKQSVNLFVTIGALYCLWCASQIYFIKPRRAAVGEEADLGVLVFLFVYFFLPLFLCISSMNSNRWS